MLETNDCMHPPPHPANIRWTPAVYREPCSRPGEFMVASQVARNQCRGGARLAVPGDQQRTACTRQAGVPSGERLNSSEVQGCRCSWGLTGPMGIELSSTEVNLRASQMQEGGSFALPMWCPPPPTPATHLVLEAAGWSPLTAVGPVGGRGHL